MLFDLLSGDFNGLDLLISLFSSLFVVFCTMPIHEYAHALIATKLGDQTARLSGRLTINPMAHISPLGALMILLCGFGYAKPVPVNPRNFKDAKIGMALTAIAGPIANILMALIAMIIANFFSYFMYSNFGDIAEPVYLFMYYAALINVNLAVFNLLPIPPLDGSRILQLIIPAKYYYKFMQYERYIIIVVFVLIYTGILSTPLSILSSLLFTVIDFISSVPYMFF